MKKVTDLGENEVIHCPTEKDAIEICQLMHDAVLKWCTHKTYISSNKWFTYGEEMCYCPKSGTHGSISWFTENGYKVYQASKFLKHNSKEPKPIDKVTVDLLDISLRLCGIEIHKSVLDKVIDVVELLEEKGGKATIDDFEDLKDSWK